MNFCLRLVVIIAVLCGYTLSSSAQEIARGDVAPKVSASQDEKNSGALNSSAETLESQLNDLEQRLEKLRSFLSTLPASSTDYQSIKQAILRMSNIIDELSGEIDKKETNDKPLQNPVGYKQPTAALNNLDQNKPEFSLAVPGNTLTNESTSLTLAWTADRTPIAQRNYTVNEYIVEISTERNFSFIVHAARVPARKPAMRGGVLLEPSGSYSVPKDVLSNGIRYYWRVSASYTLQSGATPNPEPATNAPFSFTTSLSLFEALEKRNLKLQRTVEGPNAGKGAQFAFLTTFNEGTVFTADFALIHNKRFSGIDGYFWQSSIEGKLTSKESQSEDAWRFRTGVVIDKGFRKGGFNGLYILLGGKYEGDQKFETKKLSFEAMLTPTIRQLAFGYAYPQDTAAPIQFMWRPYISLDLGRTFRRGDSNEMENTVLRIVPRLTADVSLNFISRPLKLSDTVLYFDNTFYALPLEERKTRNMFVSGLEFSVTDNFGFGFTYKNGESAPKFKRVNTFGGVLTIKFGQASR